jgi:hypothetical protein
MSDGALDHTRARADAAGLAGSVRQAAAHTGDYVQARAARLTDDVRLASRRAIDAAETAGATVRRWTRALQDGIRSRPLLALGIAVTAGYVLGKVLLGRR